MRDHRTRPSHKLSYFLRCRPRSDNDEDYPPPEIAGASSSPSHSSITSPSASTGTSPYNLSPWNPSADASTFIPSPWTHSSAAIAPFPDPNSAGGPTTGLLGSLVRKEGHVYSLAASGDLLFTGSESKNIRVWKNHCDFSGFKSSSGFVKAIVVFAGRVFTGHEDGKIRVWKASSNDPTSYKRVGTLPRLKDFLKSSIKPSSYVEVRRHRNAVWLKHFDAVSCLSLDAEHGLLYSGSWDRTLKVWRISDSKCLQSVRAHDDAVNTVAAGFGNLVLSGSADGAVNVWEREEGTGRHKLVRTLMRWKSAVTAISVAEKDGVVYCGSSDGLVNYWVRGRRLERGGVLRGHKMALLCLAAEGRMVVSGSADKTVCVWRRDGVGLHERVAVLTGHEGPIKCLAVVEDVESGGEEGGSWVVYSGSLDRSVKVWRVVDRPSGDIPTLPPAKVRTLH